MWVNEIAMKSETHEKSMKVIVPLYHEKSMKTLCNPYEITMKWSWIYILSPVQVCTLQSNLPNKTYIFFDYQLVK